VEEEEAAAVLQHSAARSGGYA